MCIRDRVSDIRMPGGSGIDLLAQVKQRHPGLPVIIMTAFSDLDSAVSAFQGGAFEYLPKPFDAVSYTHLRAHETVLDLVCRLLLEKIKYGRGDRNYWCIGRMRRYQEEKLWRRTVSRP